MNIKAICSKCGKEFDIYKKTYNRKIKNNESLLCKECRYKKQAEFNKNYMNSLSDEEKAKRSKQSSEGAKKQWQNMSKEEKIKRSKNSSERMSKYNNNHWSDISIEDKEKAMKRIHEGRDRWYRDLSQEEKNNRIQLLNTKHDEWWNSLSEEDKEKWSKQSSDNRIKYLENLSDEERIRQYELISKSLKKYWSNISNEEREKYSKMASDRNRKRWDALSDEEKSHYIKILHKSNIEYWNTLSDDERQKISNKIKDAWNNLSEDEKNEKLLILQNGNKEWRNNLTKDDIRAISEQQSKNSKKRWDNMTDNDRDNFSKQISSLMKEFWENISTEQRDAIRSSISISRKKWWNNLPESDKDIMINNLHERRDDWWEKSPITSKEAFIKKLLASSIGKNKLHQYFESRFNELNYDLIHEYPTTNHEVTHCWDYAVFKDDTLQLLVDLDGAYFHADMCDYDGMHSKLEYDGKRGLSIPNNVKWCIIYEKEFDKSFAYMKSIIDLTYNEFIEKRVKEYRSMPFPYPEYTDAELIKSYRDLCKLNCDDKYHQNISLDTRVGDRLIMHFHRSLYNDTIEVWNDDESLRDMIKHGYLYHSYINKNKILQGFNIYEPCKRTQFISAGKAKMIIHRYLNEYDEMFDPFIGIGSHMLGCISLNKRYVGQDISEVRVRENNEMITFLRDQYTFDTNIRCCDSLHTSGKYECLFTEVSNDDQIDVCLSRFRCKRYVFVVDETVKYKDNIADIITNKSHHEKIIVIEGQ